MTRNRTRYKIVRGVVILASVRTIVVDGLRDKPEKVEVDL